MELEREAYVVSAASLRKTDGSFPKSERPLWKLERPGYTSSQKVSPRIWVPPLDTLGLEP